MNPALRVIDNFFSTVDTHMVVIVHPKDFLMDGSFSAAATTPLLDLLSVL